MKKILVVDDNPFYAKVLTDKLPKEDYEILIAHNGEEGLEMVKKDRPDLVLLDIKMPKLDGIGFLKNLQSDNGTPQVPVLIFSNINDLDKMSEGVALGVRGYIVKSLESLEHIVNDVKRVLETNDEIK